MIIDILSSNYLTMNKDQLFINEEMRNLYNNLVAIPKRGYKDAKLLPPYKIRKYEAWEKEYLGTTDIENSKFSARLSILNQIFHSTFYTRTSISCSFIIMYKYNDTKSNFGKILDFFEHNSKIYASIIKFEVQSNGFQTNQHMLNFKNDNILEDFFFVKIRESQNTIIDVTNIIAKAIEIKVNGKIFLTYIQDDDEHD